MSLIGCVDALTGACICGWAADDADFGRIVEIQVIVNSMPVATVPCVTFREDLRAAGIGNGCKGFEFDPGAYLKPGRNSLEVRYAGVDMTVHKGRGQWVSRREGAREWETALIAVLEAYHKFTPHDHIVAVGAEAESLGRAFRETQVPFRRFASLEGPVDPATSELSDQVDVLVLLDAPAPTVESVGVILDHTKTNGLAAIGFDETPEAPAQIRQAFAACCVPQVKYESIAPPAGPRKIFAFAEAGGPQQVRAPEVPLLAHIHVPKCAGTSFRVLLESYFGPRHLRLYVNDTYFVYGDEALRSYLLQDPEIRGLSSHHVRSFPRWVAGREMLYITFLRDPIEQFVSYMTHVKKLYSKITAKSLLEAVPPDAPHLSLREFAKWLLTQTRDIPFRENHNVNFFSRHNSPAAPDRLEAAKAALDGFFFVGIAERMDESMNMLRVRAKAAGLDFPHGPAPVENTSNDYRDDLSWIHPGDEVGSMLLRSVEKDRQLYDWAVARWYAAYL